MSEMNSIQAMKQTARTFGLNASERLKVVGHMASRSDTKALDLAVVKATTAGRHTPPKEKHVQALVNACQRSDTEASYVIRRLLGRLHEASDWLTACKTLSVLHRLLSDCPASQIFGELARQAPAPSRERGSAWRGSASASPPVDVAPLRLDNFLDTTNVEGRFDFSEWVRAYGRYLDEQVRVFHAMDWCVQGGGAGGAQGGPPSRQDSWGERRGWAEEAGPRSATHNAEGRSSSQPPSSDFGGFGEHGASAVSRPGPVSGAQPAGLDRLRNLPPGDLLHQLPHLQRLLRRVLDCVPRGAASLDDAVLYALSMVVRESFRVYSAAAQGVIRLSECFFDLPHVEAVRGMELYREAAAATDSLAAYYAAVDALGARAREGAMPRLVAPPADFLASMQAHVDEAAAAAAREQGAGGEEGAAPVAAPRGPLRRGKLGRPAGAVGSDGGAAPAPGAGLAFPGLPAASSGDASPLDEAGAEGADSSPMVEPTGSLDLLGGPLESLQLGQAALPPPAAAVRPPPPRHAGDLLGDLLSDPGADPFAGGAASASGNPFGDPFASQAPRQLAPAPPPVDPFASQAPRRLAPAPPPVDPFAAFPLTQPGAGSPGFNDDPFAFAAAPAPASGRAQGTPSLGQGLGPRAPAREGPKGELLSARAGQEAVSLFKQAGTHDPFAQFMGPGGKAASPEHAGGGLI